MSKDDLPTLDLSKLGDTTWIEKTFGDITKASAAKQISVGAATGWVAGYVGGKIGKAAATAVGGTLLILQVAHYKGFIDINWGKLEKEYDRAKKMVGKDAEKHLSGQADAVREFARANVLLASGFACGFLIGLAS